ncbi:MAG TPA: dTDP-4-dehydrorhamnose 3,5-epimerase [Acidimicrobiales bacterium]|nr:dTDP-4-dehydrorhamnose 3,5-epimerase [Acidimicrobiales bacterium]
MRVHHTSIPGLLVFEPEPKADERGFFVRTLSADALAQEGVDQTSFVQENQSRSRRGTLRGLHLRGGSGEAKLVRCSQGRIFDVVVDLRPSLPSFGRYQSFRLDDVRHLHLHIPAGCAHGFQTLSEVADTCYHHDQFYDPRLDAAVAWDDADIAISWPLAEPILSDRDRSAPSLRDMRPQLEEWFGNLRP